jgi:hypothetical protein
VSTLPPKINVFLPARPFDPEGLGAPKWLVEEYRRQSGNLPDSSPEMPVVNDQPFRLKQPKSEKK